MAEELPPDPLAHIAARAQHYDREFQRHAGEPIRLPSEYFLFGDPILSEDGWMRPLLWRRGGSLLVVGAVTDADAAARLCELLNAIEIEGVR